MNIENFNTQIGGKEVALYLISSKNISCYITNYGARVVSLLVGNHQNKHTDVVLGFNSIDDYINANEQYHGATVGRFANRIADGKFSLSDLTYKLEANNGSNSLHGGTDGFHQKVWTIKEACGQRVTLEYTSPDMEVGFPGELTVQVTYQIEGSNLLIFYTARSTKETVINLTHHSYFNLNGEGSGSILDHALRINSEYYTPVNENTIPTGKLEHVSGTPFDFTKDKMIGVDIDQEHDQIKLGGGYDHNFVVKDYLTNRLSRVATVKGDKSNIEMQVWSTEPGVQLYTANHFDGTDTGKSGEVYSRREAFCLETQHFPDSPNHRHFPTTVLKESATFRSSTEYRFKLV